ncbi:MAG: site-specific integrase, partial [Parachlamydia sp.]|nr:site-specific integrase [Parachlamydia sp.]
LHDPNEIYEAIRCHREWSLLFRERLVLAYQNFLSYLWARTNEYIILRPDLEKESVKNREVSFREFVSFADLLKDNLQLIAKLLYFGGDRILDEVMKLTISDVNFDEHLIRYGSQVVRYPLHVFADIKAIIGRRTKGNLFLGRQDALLNPTTVFRNFKDVGSKAGLGSNFSPASLTRNK